jgi:spore coat protein U-like protein
MSNIKRAAVRTAGIALFACAAGGVPGVATAQTASSTLNVSATVTANCTVSTSDVAFGNVNTLSGSNVDTIGAISVTCTNDTDWSAAAGVGSGSGATFASRRMSNGANLLTYNLFTDAARSSVWGDGTGSTVDIDGTGTGAVQNIAIYGRVGSGQTSVPAGNYADTVAVTVSY